MGAAVSGDYASQRAALGAVGSGGERGGVLHPGMVNLHVPRGD